MRIKRFLVLLLCVVWMFPGNVLADAAVGGDYNYQDADFYVVVNAPDNYVNFRYGPGMEYGINFPIYNGEILHVTTTADNYYDGLWWGQVEYNGQWGWISISQTSVIENPDPLNQSNADVIRGIRDTGYLVEDAYYYEEDSVFSIPMIQLDSEAIRALNKQIYQVFYPQIQDALQQVPQPGALLELTYTWSVNDDILSLVIYAAYGGPWQEYTVFNISISEQSILFPVRLIEEAGWSDEDYLEKAKAVMEQSFHDQNDARLDAEDANAREWFDNQLAETLSSENLDAAQPYLNAEGHLCIVGKIGLFRAQNSHAWIELDLQKDASESEDPYYVRVTAAAGNTFLRREAGSSKQSLLPVPYGQKLLILETETDPEDSSVWGRTAFNGQPGWILLSDTVDCR